MDRARLTVATEAAPAAIGPYSQAVRHGDTLYCSGAIPLDPASGEVVAGEVGDEATQCLRNLAAVCEAAGTTLAQALRLTVYTTELERFAEINEAYAAFFHEVGPGPDAPPARVTVGVGALPKAVRVEIDAIVAIEG